MLPEHLLQQVERPARYLGGEWNQVVKPASQVDLRVALCYPDTYEVGMSHAGLRILYEVVNRRQRTAAERVFLPWVDAISLMRDEGLSLASLETGTPLSQFDVVGITLQHELTFTNVLELLDLGGIPVRTRSRQGPDPLVIGGGPCAFNPEPVADFFDALVIGDGEEALDDILDLFLSLPDHLRLRPVRSDDAREALLQRLATIEGVYVPSGYRVRRTAHDTLVPEPRSEVFPDRVTRRVAEDLGEQPWPCQPVVPLTEAVHDRAEIEITRGCTRGCRFCQAGMIYRPVRERHLDQLVEQAERIIATTGYDELSLLSLNCPDYSQIAELIDRLHECLAEDHVSVSMPSLRVDTFSIGLAERLQRVRKSGLTLAPEAGSQRLRDIINKDVTRDDLLSAVEAAFRSGWQRLKLYFMIGLPHETDEDVAAIGDLIDEVLAIARRELSRSGYGRLKINVSVNAFIPKPHTPFQWLGMADLQTLRRRRDLLHERVTNRRVTLSVSDFRSSMLEAALARGDRGLCSVVERAWRAGARFDGWSERFQFDRWQQAFAEHARDLLQEAQRLLPVNAELPWDVIDSGITKQFLRRELERARAGERTPDCRAERCHNCGMTALVPECPPVRWQPVREEAVR
ncbi:MAG: TIGR03960 family B12-binding radical SAM protein [Armatimonadota bacterium]|nr:TIGR03960 family B12-binding radical SAM protein [Armatimonadota bacterium]